MRNLKCPICGNEEFVDIENPFRIVNGDGDIRTSATMCACTKCGLMLVFSQESAYQSMSKLNKRSEIDNKIRDLRNQITDLEKEKEQLPGKIGALEREKLDPNRTVARDQQLGEEIRSLKSRLSGIDSQIARIRDEIRRLEDSKRFL